MSTYFVSSVDFSWDSVVVTNKETWESERLRLDEFKRIMKVLNSQGIDVDGYENDNKIYALDINKRGKYIYGGSIVNSNEPYAERSLVVDIRQSYKGKLPVSNEVKAVSYSYDRYLNKVVKNKYVANKFYGNRFQFRPVTAEYDFVSEEVAWDNIVYLCGGLFFKPGHRAYYFTDTFDHIYNNMLSFGRKSYDSLVLTHSEVERFVTRRESLVMDDTDWWVNNTEFYNNHKADWGLTRSENVLSLQDMINHGCGIYDITDNIYIDTQDWSNNVRSVSIPVMYAEDFQDIGYGDERYFEEHRCKYSNEIRNYALEVIFTNESFFYQIRGISSAPREVRYYILGHEVKEEGILLTILDTGAYAGASDFKIKKTYVEDLYEQYRIEEFYRSEVAEVRFEKVNPSDLYPYDIMRIQCSGYTLILDMNIMHEVYKRGGDGACREHALNKLRKGAGDFVVYESGELHKIELSDINGRSGYVIPRSATSIGANSIVIDTDSIFIRVSDNIKSIHKNAFCRSQYRPVLVEDYNIIFEFDTTDGKLVNKILTTFVNTNKGETGYTGRFGNVEIAVSPSNWAVFLAEALSCLNLTQDRYSPLRISRTPFFDTQKIGFEITPEMMDDFMSYYVKNKLDGFTPLAAENPRIKITSRINGGGYKMTEAAKLYDRSDSWYKYDPCYSNSEGILACYEHDNWVQFWAMTNWFKYWFTYERLRRVFMSAKNLLAEDRKIYWNMVMQCAKERFEKYMDDCCVLNNLYNPYQKPRFNHDESY